MHRSVREGGGTALGRSFADTSSHRPCSAVEEEVPDVPGERFRHLHGGEVAAVLDRPADAGCVHREPGPADRRRDVITLTPAAGRPAGPAPPRPPPPRVSYHEQYSTIS